MACHHGIVVVQAEHTVSRGEVCGVIENLDLVILPVEQTIPLKALGNIRKRQLRSAPDCAAVGVFAAGLLNV